MSAGNRLEYPKYESHYLAVGNNFLTPNNILFQNITGPISSTTLLNPIRTFAEKLALNFTIQSVSGVNPSLDIVFLALDPLESSNGISTGNFNPPVISLKLNNTPINSPSTIRFVIQNSSANVWINGIGTSLGNLDVPFCWQVQLQVQGTAHLLA